MTDLRVWLVLPARRKYCNDPNRAEHRAASTLTSPQALGLVPSTGLRMPDSYANICWSALSHTIWMKENSCGPVSNPISQPWPCQRHHTYIYLSTFDTNGTIMQPTCFKDTFILLQLICRCKRIRVHRTEQGYALKKAGTRYSLALYISEGPFFRRTLSICICEGKPKQISLCLGTDVN